MILMKRARIQGFIVMDYLNRAPEAVADLSRWFMEGKIKYRVDLVEGLENAASAVNRLFSGANVGKLVLKI
jgi:NADPH-dependent curcumin reductase CurA